MNTTFYAALAVHIAAGTLALILGLPPIFTRKGERRHRLIGGWYRRTMYVVLGSAAVMTLIAMNPYFAALTVGAATSTFSGLRVLRRKRPDIEAADRAQPLDWAFTLGAAAVLLLLLVSTPSGRAGLNTTVFYSLLGGAAVYILWDLWRFLFPAAWPFFPKLWFYEHLVKMLASVSAVVAAFSGSVLYFLPIPDPWKQLWPTILFHNLMIGMILWYALVKPRLTRRRAALQAA
jgi:uncharacterized membrane protein